MAIVLAVYTATSGIGASVALEVTSDLRARNKGSKAWVIAITPKVLLVSNTSRAFQGYDLSRSAVDVVAPWTHF